MADIEKMYFQILAADEHRSLLKLLWWKDGEMSKEIIDHEMCVHVFGSVSSGACSNYALRRTAIEIENKYGKDAAETVKNNFYVDDMLKSVENEDKAITLMKGGFNMTKFASSSKRVLQSIPEKDRKIGVKNSDLLGSLPKDRALGVLWNVENDTLGFKVNLKEKPLTRRGVLSVLSSIYDPLGFGAPFQLKGKKIMQKLCQQNLKWDEDIPDEISNEWLTSKENIPNFEMVYLQRCFKPLGFEKSSRLQLTSFLRCLPKWLWQSKLHSPCKRKGKNSLPSCNGKSLCCTTQIYFNA